MEYFKLLISNQVEGILFYPVGDMSSKNLYQYMRYVPIVSLNEMPDNSPIPYVCGDERKGGSLAAERLIRGGCKKILGCLRKVLEQTVCRINVRIEFLQ